MPRTASPVTPGTNPTTSSTASDTADQADARDEQREVDSAAATGTGAQAADGPTMQELQAQVALLMKRDEQREAQLQAALAQRAAASAEPPAPVPRPTMAETLKQKPASPVLTTEGWYVPAVLPGHARKDG
ncbi:hypothetical protein [uncultured Pseudacidovorax sp.]|uniref:hypothetical protein n=1 Tax=uncultured Pseudacidovorax sp. TaxID=679313 RepID=UPI0025D16D7B|nr:hypothetical protein [uncultured Pseudacidovorax sp.]